MRRLYVYYNMIILVKRWIYIEAASSRLIDMTAVSWGLLSFYAQSWTSLQSHQNIHERRSSQRIFVVIHISSESNQEDTHRLVYNFESLQMRTIDITFKGQPMPMKKIIFSRLYTFAVCMILFQCFFTLRVQIKAIYNHDLNVFSCSTDVVTYIFLTHTANGI